MSRLTALLIAVAALGACAGPDRVSGIDYSRPASWLARPDMDSSAKSLQTMTLHERDDGSHVTDWAVPADVFYIHPTTGMRHDVDNVPIDDPQALAIGNLMLAAQASPFSGLAHIYAPRYRQATLDVFNRSGDALQKPMNLAYEDVRQAFVYYMTHLNHGRPYFLLGHSQGSNHGLRLLAEEIDNTPHEAGLIAAYLPGMPVPQDVFGQALRRVLPCTSADQIRCVAAWGVFAQGYRDFGDWEAINVYWDVAASRWRSAKGRRLFNVNPVNWKADGTPASRSEHKGAMPFGVPGSDFQRPLSQLVSTRSGQGYTLVSPALPAHLFNDEGMFDAGNYHVFDINLFWADIRANARQRLCLFMAQDDPAFCGSMVP